ncbi:alpha/beta hydrolase [Paenibacillus tarimensis]|uniref:alpha/beta hydrolase n=1 Tax=Paenibacillus tarimensis TaxID=416012 RepID=UPI001F1BCF89|nr:alpha/beta fold hydrolase [Paenibacillus tarimensis]MCF2945186.1 alpha/beta hydrolase [Paenibacillus tarimensis]
MYEHTLEIDTERGRLAAVLHLPCSRMGRPPLVVYCPGKNGERSDSHRLGVSFARSAAAQGVAVMRFDYYGMGLSDGEYHQMTVSTKVSDTVDVCRYVEGLTDVEFGSTALLGFSDGARTALLAANRIGVSRLILWSPLFQEWGGDYPLGRRPRFMRHPADEDALVLPWAGLWVGMPFYKELQCLDMKEHIRRYKGTSIMIYGDDDPLVAEERERLNTSDLSIYSGSRTHKVHAMEEAGHLFASVELGERLIEHTIRWLCDGKY